MIEGKFNDSQYESFLEDVQKQDKVILDKKYFEFSNFNLYGMKIMQVRLEIGDMIECSMVHNDTTLLRGSQCPPYREDKYLKIIRSFLQEGEVPSENKAKMINREIMYHKQKHLLEFFQREKYSFVSILKDGNCGPRAVSVFVWGTESKYKVVREDVYKSSLKKLKEA